MTTTQTTKTAIAYLRVSTDAQGADGLGIEAQRHTIATYCATQGIEILDEVVEVMSGKSIKNRPLLNATLDRLAKHQATMLIASNVSRLARSVADLSTMLEAADRKGYGIAAIDTGLDTSTPSGRMVIQMLGVAAEFERAMISYRTKKALAAAKSRGVVLGARKQINDSVESIITRKANEGLTYQGIADYLNAKTITTPSGLTWKAMAVRKVAVRNGVEARGQGRRKVADRNAPGNEKTATLR